MAKGKQQFYQSPAVCRHDVTWVPGIMDKPRDMTCYCERCGVQMSHDNLEVLGVGTTDVPPAMLPALQELHRLRRQVHGLELDKANRESSVPEPYLLGQDTEARALRILRDVVNTINQTGGIVYDDEGLAAPASDPDWLDLGLAYRDACELLKLEPQEGTN